ncbi:MULTISPECIES: glycosyltransferase family 2 protein [Bacteroides]|uniref:Glycosyltransferase n=1 Tax=Bacteroides muris (ex Afrizal et al. 2022) TaxID=2516960 RepID=A0A4S2B633_9BACE|nr:MULTISPECIES: glycosyltransferase family 2 protein [Bacteroides]TGY09618.1 glycosyltransferase [Bacteroides muris (ex Afrizal et al. 2022)]
MRPKLSIITVNFNNNSGLSKTLESVRHQSFSSYEHIIIDAGSKDGSLETIKQYAEGNPHVTFWVSEPDKGIYDGMNKGMEHAGGEYLQFLNSGDFLVGDVLGQVDFDGTEYIYGDVRVAVSADKKINIQSPFPLDLVFILLKDTICHQVCFIHHSLFNNQRYRTDYILASDWIHIVENIILRGCSYKRVPVCIAEYDGNGISASSGSLGVDERMRWIKDNIPAAFYDSLLELDRTRMELNEYKNSELGKIIPIVSHTRRFSKRARKLVLFLYRINSIFSSSSRRHKNQKKKK